jgi:hypothetical protein
MNNRCRCGEYLDNIKFLRNSEGRSYRICMCDVCGACYKEFIEE